MEAQRFIEELEAGLDFAAALLLLLLFEDAFQGCQSSFGRRLGAPMQSLPISIGSFIAAGKPIIASLSSQCRLELEGSGAFSHCHSTVSVAKCHGDSILGVWTASWDAVPHQEEGWL
jgi:hypothetical protein